MLKNTVLLEGRCLQRLRPTGRKVLRTTVVATQPPVQRGTAKDPIRRPGWVAPGRNAFDDFILVLAFLPVFGGFGFFRCIISVMQRWISYSTKTLRDFFVSLD
jgi:hypothetical protein